MRLRRGVSKFLSDTFTDPPVVSALKGNSPSGLIFLSGRNCNFRCRSCLTDSGPKRDEIANPDNLPDIFKNLKPLLETGSVKFVTISGGEPMLNLDFVVGLSSLLMETYNELGINMPFFGIITNGSVIHDNTLKSLEPFKGFISILYSDDSYHQKFHKKSLVKSDSPLDLFRRAGFRVEQMPKLNEFVSVGRGFDLPDVVPRVQTCEAARIHYVKEGEIVKVVSVKDQKPQRFMVDEKGNLLSCGYLGPVLGNLISDSLLAIKSRISSNGRLKRLVRLGPLEDSNNLESDFELLSEKGPCALCSH